jgi:MYXO-CTERM domain-containing protein
VEDNGPLVDNPGQLDDDGDGLGDLCDEDDDGDETIDDADNCPLVDNPEQLDDDGDGLGDACDEDLDGDETPDAEDNCPLIENPEQLDADADGLGDICDEQEESGNNRLGAAEAGCGCSATGDASLGGSWLVLFSFAGLIFIRRRRVE